MIELLILYKLSKKVLTMYGISRDIHDDFSVMTTPSYGTIKPALTRLEKSGFVKSQKTLSTGGRPSVYYSITKDGINALEELLLSPIKENPIQYLTTARVRVACAEVLGKSEQKNLLRLLKQKAESIMLDTKNLLENNDYDYLHKMVLDNLLCEYKNFISLLEGLERACNN